MTPKKLKEEGIYFIKCSKGQYDSYKKMQIDSVMLFINIHYKKKVELMSLTELDTIARNYFKDLLSD